MIIYLFDTSVAAEFYRPKRTFKPGPYTRHRALVAHVTDQRLKGEAILFLPTFCVTEVKNTFAKWHYRRKKIFKDHNHYKSVLGAFIAHVHDRKFFYCYDLSRYHNLNADEIIPHEQRTKETPGKGFLSSLDILIIAMGIELRQIHGEVHLLTNDERMFTIAKLRPNIFPTPYLWRDLALAKLPKA